MDVGTGFDVAAKVGVKTAVRTTGAPPAFVLVYVYTVGGALPVPVSGCSTTCGGVVVATAAAVVVEVVVDERDVDVAVEERVGDVTGPVSVRTVTVVCTPRLPSVMSSTTVRPK